jgi:hypothetical protein
MPPPSAFQASSSSSRPSKPGLAFTRGRARTVSSPVAPETVPPPPHASPRLVTPPVPTRSTSPVSSTYSSTFSHTDTTGQSRSSSPLSLRGPSDFVHPYANPELAFDAGPVVHSATSFLPPSTLSRRVVVPSDSIATVSESVVTQSSSTLTPDTSMSSVTDYHADVVVKKVIGSVQGKVISNPLITTPGQNAQATQDKSQPSLPGQVPGWTELAVSPTFNLISLQEAQAQARERSRTHTQAIPEAPFLQSEPPPRNNPTALPGNAVRLRTRTASAGSKVKIQPLAISNPVPLPHSGPEDTLVTSVGSTPPVPRSLKQKRSGFMRLFNGKDKDKLSSQSPPPLPPVAAPSLPRTPKISSARVPVPTLSPSLVPHSPLQFDDIMKSDGGDCGSAEDHQPQGGIKRHYPPLSILTHDAPALLSASGVYPKTAHPGRSTSTLLSETSTSLGVGPASAPPSTGAFRELSLRPISTVFSAHFADHIVSTESSPTSAQLDTSSTATAHSPMSPASTQRSFDEKLTACEDDAYVIIQQLQEQIKSTRKAWQHQIWELEGQVRDLRAEIDDMRIKETSGERCLLCGRDGSPERGAREAPRPDVSRPGVVDRPRARTGVGTRFGAAT